MELLLQGVPENLAAVITWENIKFSYMQTEIFILSKTIK